MAVIVLVCEWSGQRSESVSLRTALAAATSATGRRDQVGIGKLAQLTSPDSAPQVAGWRQNVDREDHRTRNSEDLRNGTARRDHSRSRPSPGYRELALAVPRLNVGHAPSLDRPSHLSHASRSRISARAPSGTRLARRRRGAHEARPPGWSLKGRPRVCWTRSPRRSPRKSDGERWRSRGVEDM